MKQTGRRKGSRTRLKAIAPGVLKAYELEHGRLRADDRWRFTIWYHKVFGEPTRLTFPLST